MTVIKNNRGSYNFEIEPFKKEKEHKKMTIDIGNDIQLEIIGDVVWFNYKGYDVRIEKNKEHNNNHLVITATPKGQEDYVGRLEID